MAEQNNRRYINAARPLQLSSRLKSRNDPSTDLKNEDSRGFKRKISSDDFSEYTREKKVKNVDQFESSTSRTPTNGSTANQRLQNLRKSLSEKQIQISGPKMLEKSKILPESSKIDHLTAITITHGRSPLNKLSTSMDKKFGSKTVDKSKFGPIIAEASKLAPKIAESSSNLEKISPKSIQGPLNRNFRERMSNLSSIDQNSSKSRRSVQDRLKIKRESGSESSKNSLNKSLPNIFLNNCTSSETLTNAPTEKLDTFASKNVSINNLSSSSVEIPEKNYLDKSYTSTDVEMMDWIPSEEIIIENVNEVRKELSQKDYPLNISILNENENNILDSKNFYIVVDTNIFLAHLEFLKRLKNKKLKDGKSIIIYVPWMVLQELDYMKINQGQSHLCLASKKAIDFINTCLSQNDSSLKGQNVIDVSNQNFDSNNPDDGILFACIQLKMENKNVVLLSNDKNLRNKAIFSDISAFSQDTILSDLIDKNFGEIKQKNKNIHVLINPMKNLLNEIIKFEMIESYGDKLWIKIVTNKIGYQPPYNFEDCLSIFQKYWKSVFSLKLLKQAKLCIDEFSNFVRENQINSGNVSDEIFTKFIEFSLRLCIYLKNGCHGQRSLVYDTINTIQKNSQDPTSDK